MRVALAVTLATSMHRGSMPRTPPSMRARRRLTVHATIAGSSMKRWLNADTTNAITATDTAYAAGGIGIRSYKSAVVSSRVKVTCR